MPEDRVYSYKILQNVDLSQNDLLNVRRINNDDYNVLIDSENQVQIESKSHSDPRLSIASVKVEPDVSEMSSEAISDSQYDYIVEVESLLQVDDPDSSTLYRVLSDTSEDAEYYIWNGSGFIELQNPPTSKSFVRTDASDGSVTIKGTNSIDAETPEFNVSASTGIVLSSPSTKMASGDNYMEVTPTSGDIHVEDGVLEIDAEQSISSVSGKSLIKQTSDVGATSDSDNIEISVKKESTPAASGDFSSSISLDKTGILEEGDNITLDSDTLTEVKSDGSVIVRHSSSSSDGGYSNYSSTGITTTGGTISDVAGNSSEVINKQNGISRVSDTRDVSTVESGNLSSVVDILPSSESFEVSDSQTGKSSEISIVKDEILVSSCEDVRLEVTENPVGSGANTVYGHIEIKTDTVNSDNIVRIDSQADIITLKSMQGNNLNEISLTDEGASVDIPSGNLEMSSDNRMVSSVGDAKIVLTDSNSSAQGENPDNNPYWMNLSVTGSSGSKNSSISLDEDSIKSSSNEIILESGNLTELKSETLSKIGVKSGNSYSSYSSYTDGVITSSADTIDMVGSGTHEIKIGDLGSNSEGIHLSSDDKISSVSENVEIKLTDYNQVNEHSASINLDTYSDGVYTRKKVEVSATDGVTIKAPAAPPVDPQQGSSDSTSSIISLESDRDIRVDAERDVVISSDDSVNGTGKIVTSGNLMEMNSSTTSILSPSINIGVSNSSNVAVRGEIDIQGPHNLSIESTNSTLNESKIVSDNLVFNKTLKSNEINIYWDNSNKALVFSKI